MNRNNIIKFKLQHLLSRIKTSLNLGKNQDANGWEHISVIFVISTGRTGTHFLSHFFNNNFKNVHALHEPQKDIFDLNIQYLRGNVRTEVAGKMLKDFRTEVLFKLTELNKNTYVESNNNLSCLIPVIRREFPNYKIIYIQRDGRDFVSSMYSKMTRGKWVGDIPVFSDKDPRDRLQPKYLKDDKFMDDWKSMDRFQKICWVWSRMDAIVHKEAKKDDNILTVKFESLFKEKNIQEWNRMIDFVNLNDKLINKDIMNYIDENKSNQTKEKKISNWKEWTNEQKNHFTNIAGAHMKLIGYEID